MKANWINIEAAFVCEQRACLVHMTRVGFIGAGIGGLSDYLDVFRKWDDHNYVEGVVRQFLSKEYKGSEDWVIVWIRSSISRQCIEALVEHPSFNVVPIGCEAPVLEVEFSGS